MDKEINLKIREFQEAIRQHIKVSCLPPEVVRLALAELQREVCMDADRNVLDELEQRKKERGEADAESIQSD